MHHPHYHGGRDLQLDRKNNTCGRDITYIQQTRHPHNNLWSGDLDTNQERGRNPTEDTKQHTETNPKNPNNNTRRNSNSRNRNMGHRNPNNEKTINILPQNKNQKTRRKPNQQDSTRPKEPMEEKN